MLIAQSRSCGNTVPGLRRLIGILLMLAGLSLVGCAGTPHVPPNVILQDVHNNGYTLAFGTASTTFASGGSEGRIRLWSLPEAKEVAGWKAHNGSLQGLQFLNDDREILSAAYDGMLARWTRDGTQLKYLVTPSPITDMAVDEAGDLVVTGHGDGHVRLWHLAEFSLIQDLSLHHGAVLAVAYHAPTRQLASSGTDGHVFRWFLEDQPRPLPSPPTDSQDLAFVPDGSILMGGGWFRLYHWRLTDESLTILPTAHHGLVKSISFDRDGRQLASIGRYTDSAVYLADTQTGSVLKRLQPHELCGTTVLFSPDGRYLASTSDDASVHLWDLQNLLP